MKRTDAILLLLLDIFLLLPAACQSGGNSSDSYISGHVEATEVRIAPKVGGRIQELKTVEGDSVQAGQEVARIDPVDLLLALQSARAARGQAAADLDLLVAGARKEDIAEAAARVDQARAELQAAGQDLQRMQGLLDSGSGTPKSRDDALARRDAADAALRASEERLRRLRAGSRPEEIQAARARVQGADALIAQLEQQIADATVTSPVGGIVTEKLVEQGEMVQPGTPLLVVSDLEHAWLTTYVSEPDLARIRIGEEVEVVTDSGAKRKGHVSFIASQAEFTPKNVQTRDERIKLVFKVKVLLENSDGIFKPGMPAEARFPNAGRSR